MAAQRLRKGGWAALARTAASSSRTCACARSARCTPLKLVHDRLLEEARLRLENTEFPVEQIAYGLGFRDPGYFNRFFKRLTGVAPGTYRQTIATARSTNDAPSFAAWP